LRFVELHLGLPHYAALIAAVDAALSQHKGLCALGWQNEADNSNRKTELVDP